MGTLYAVPYTVKYANVHLVQDVVRAWRQNAPGMPLKTSPTTGRPLASTTLRMYSHACISGSWEAIARIHQIPSYGHKGTLPHLELEWPWKMNL
jgi:hypothetical protein